jgi:ribosome-associated translation inhibitor RaiA
MAIIEIEGVDARSTLRDVIHRKLESAFARKHPQPVSIRIDFTDENGPKGGVGTRCGITVELPRRRKAVHVEHEAENPRLAFDAAVVSLERQFERERGRAMTKRRRPKKYYVAKRLLNPDESLETLAEESPKRKTA